MQCLKSHSPRLSLEDNDEDVCVHNLHYYYLMRHSNTSIPPSARFESYILPYHQNMTVPGTWDPGRNQTYLRLRCASFSTIHLMVLEIPTDDMPSRRSTFHFLSTFRSHTLHPRNTTSSSFSQHSLEMLQDSNSMLHAYQRQLNNHNPSTTLKSFEDTHLLPLPSHRNVSYPKYQIVKSVMVKRRNRRKEFELLSFDAEILEALDRCRRWSRSRTRESRNHSTVWMLYLCGCFI